jgi:hypothetical protein
MIHITRRTPAGHQELPEIRVTLPPIPVPLDTTHADTAPRQPMIRRPMGPVKGAALKAMGREKVEAFKRALLEVIEEGEE